MNIWRLDFLELWLGYRPNIKKIFNNSAVYSRSSNNHGDLLTVDVFVYSVSPQSGSPYAGT
jgi:hypothetical protein